MGLSTGETDVYGGGAYGGGLGGLGGVGLIGLIGLNSFLGRGNGFGDEGGRGAGNVVLEQNVSNIREEIGALGNEMQSAFSLQTASQTAQFNNIGDLIMNGFSQTALAAKDATIQGLINTQTIKDQSANFQVVNQENFCSIKELIHADGDTTRALLTQNLIDGLRAELAGERRGRDQREVEINISNSAVATQSQLQAQLQQQTQAIGTALGAIQNQLIHQTNSMINLGTMTGNTQAATAANTKVNS